MAGIPTIEDRLDRAVAQYLEQRESEPSQLPGDFAAQLPADLASQFLREIEELGAIDRLTMAPPRDLPQRFQDYRIIGLIGQGGTGTVYEAEQVSLRRRVALKVLHPHVAGDLRTVRRFEREAQTVAALEHPRIAPVYEFGHSCGISYLVMGLLRGRSLHRILHAARDSRDIDHEQAVAFLSDRRQVARVFADIAEALAFAHDRGIVHRDIKPANLMVLDSGRASVLDFGMATSAAADDGADVLTRTGDFFGTPLYMSPEQAAGERDIGPRTDIYSLGAVLYECLTGKPTVSNGPLPQVLDNIRRGRIASARSQAHLGGEAAELLCILERCLERSPRTRYQSACQLADDLRRFAAHGQPQAGRFCLLRAAARRIRMFPTGRRLATAAAAALVMTISVAGVGALATERDAEPGQAPPDLSATHGGDDSFRDLVHVLFDTRREVAMINQVLKQLAAIQAPEHSGQDIALAQILASRMEFALGEILAAQQSFIDHRQAGTDAAGLLDARSALSELRSELAAMRTAARRLSRRQPAVASVPRTTAARTRQPASGSGRSRRGAGR